MSKFNKDIVEFAESSSSEWRSVLVEVCAPKVSPRGKEPNFSRANIIDENISSVVAELGKMNLPEEPVVLKSAGVIVVSITPKELRELNEMPAVAFIRPNRIHRHWT